MRSPSAAWRDVRRPQAPVGHTRGGGGGAPGCALRASWAQRWERGHQARAPRDCGGGASREPGVVAASEACDQRFPLSPRGSLPQMETRSPSLVGAQGLERETGPQQQGRPGQAAASVDKAALSPPVLDTFASFQI